MFFCAAEIFEGLVLDVALGGLKFNWSRYHFGHVSVTSDHYNVQELSALLEAARSGGCIVPGMQ